MIFEFSAAIDPGTYNLFGFVPQKVLPLLVWLVASSVLLFGLLNASPRFAFVRNPGVVMLFSLISLSASFMASYGISDEVAVNLEHAYNLYHHGLFSMSPNEIIDGTIEVPFYLLHAQFGASAQSLVLANFFICLALFLTLVMLVGGSHTLASSSVVCVLLISSWEPVVNVFSSGFGNGLPAIFFVGGLLCIIHRVPWPLVAIVFLLPFIRPDAILISGVLMVVFLIDRWKFGGHKWGLFVLGSTLSFAGFFGFLFLFNAYYGGTTPTPIQFKSISPDMLEFFSPTKFLQEIFEILKSPQRVLAIFLFLAMLCSWLLAVREKGETVFDPSKRVDILLAACVIVSTPIILFFSFSNAIVPDFAGTTERYWIVWDISLLLFFINSVSRIFASSPDGLLGGSVRLDRVAAPAIVLLGLGTLGGDTWFDNRERLGTAGGIVEDFFPESLSLATAEMNTFGLMIDRPIQDYWGYSNDVIASSDVCNGGMTRIVPDLFLDRQEDIYYMYFIGERSNFVVDTFYGAEQVMSGSVNNFARDSGFRLGDMSRVMEQYDVLIVKVPGDVIGFLVRKSKMDFLSEHLVDKGFELSRQREFDQEVFTSSYLSKPLVLRDCG